MFDFTDKNAISLAEAQKFATNAIDAVEVGIQNDKSKSTINSTVAGTDPLIARLVNNGVAQAATIEIDPCKSGREKYYIQTPYVIEDTPVGADDDGEGCCVGTPTVTACRYKLDLHELCVKDCVDSSLDEMLEEAVKQKAIDTTMPWSRVGASIAAKRAAFVAKYAKFIFERNAILGTADYSGNGLRPFNGLIERLTDDRVLKVDGSAGFISSIEMLNCRLTAMGMDLGRFLIAINPIALPTLRQEVRTYLKADPMTDWRMVGDRVFYKGMEIVTSRYVDVDLETNTTSMWLIDTSKVGIKFVRAITNPYIKRIDSTDDCGGHCITMHNAGTTVVTNWNGLMLINNIALDSICDSLALSGLEGFVNSGVIGHLYPGVTANPGL